MIPSLLSPLANHLWQSTLFAVAAGIGTLALRKNRAHTRYWLWLAASVKFLIPFSILVETGKHLGWHRAPTIVTAALPLFIGQASQPFAPSGPLLGAPGEISAPALNWIPILVCAIWAIGFTMLLSGWWRRWRTLRANLRAASSLDLPVTIAVMTSPAFAEPGVCGILRPVLLLPEGIAGRLSPAQFDAILAHELCHVRRRDNLATAVHMAVEALFWFHPLVWWLGARLMDERERACDEDVLLRGSEPEVYAEGILKICELYLESPLPCVAGVTGANLKSRIEAIMIHRVGLRLDFARKAALAAAAVAAVMIPLVVGILNAPALQAQVPQDPLTSADSAPPIAFEVASVKIAVDPGRVPMFCVVPCMPGERLTVTGDRVDIRYMSLRNLMLTAYTIKTFQLSGPEWMQSARFDIQAKMPAGVTKDRLPEMLRALLAERFKLTIHRDTREQPVYALVVGKNGPKLQEPVEEVDAAAPENPNSSPVYTPQGEAHMENGTATITKGAYGPVRSGMGPHGMKMEFLKLTMPALAEVLTPHVDRPVVDMTNLQGGFYFLVQPHFNPGGGDGRKSAAPDRAPVDADSGVREDPYGEGLFAAMDKAGLKLESRKAPVQMIVVDRLEKTPTGN